MNKHNFNNYISIIALGPKDALSLLFQITSRALKHLRLMLRPTVPNAFGMTNTIYRDLLCRSRGVIYRLKRGGSISVRWLRIYIGNGAYVVIDFVFIHRFSGIS